MKTSSKTQSIAMIGMFTAVLAVLSILQIPMPSGVPITLQTFAVALCGYCLGKKNGTLCVALYLILGFVGVPVFTGMTAGIGKLFGYTGGFLYGFLFLAFFCGLGSQLKHHAVSVLLGVVGLLICHVLGAFHYSIIATTGFGPAFLLVSVPYLVKDVLSVIGALVVALVIKKTLSKSGIILNAKTAA